MHGGDSHVTSHQSNTLKMQESGTLGGTMSKQRIINQLHQINTPIASNKVEGASVLPQLTTVEKSLAMALNAYAKIPVNQSATP
jgi:hypothetical protein